MVAAWLVRSRRGGRVVGWLAGWLALLARKQEGLEKVDLWE